MMWLYILLLVGRFFII